MSKIENPIRAKYAAIKSYSIEYGYVAKKRSLIEDAKFEHNVLHAKPSLETVQDALPECTNEKDIESIHKLMISLDNQMEGIKFILERLKYLNCTLDHIESRPTKKKRKSSFELYLEIKSTSQNLDNLIAKLKDSGYFSDVVILNAELKSSENISIPMTIWDLDKCNHLNIKYEPDIDSRHPGFSDMDYRKRRQEIADIAFTFKHGDRIPKVNYTSDEVKTWNLIYRELADLYPTHACKQHIEAMKNLEKNGIYSPDFIPQLEDVSNFLKKRSGFQLRPVAGLLSARDFLASLAFRVFQCTQYIRHSSSPLHSPEPDCVHELLGHVPLLSNPGFAEFSQVVGISSLGASDEDIIKLSTLYWFTIEFGLCRENNALKAYGAGLLSAFGELKHALSGVPQLKEFEPYTASVQEYQDEDYQPLYFIAQSFEQVRHQIKIFSKTIKRPYKLRYDPYTQSLQIVDNMKIIQEIKREVNSDLDEIIEALDNVQLMEI
ncbi:unnamed protein product [Brachionus calyciflorus]|uniref:Biopterin-dependent aromatic amino acid hydroxylase family profile domain-containing protein n=1 Tax=Brachionus calyciflorus TaxID=104777 RepID=A0A813N2V1_9BILA|nr:unnamed protein product [Brachionus calyciflorus]